MPDLDRPQHWRSLTCSRHAVSATLTTPALCRRSLRWLGTSPYRATPEDLPPSLAQHRIRRTIFYMDSSLNVRGTPASRSSASCAPASSRARRSCGPPRRSCLRASRPAGRARRSPLATRCSHMQPPRSATRRLPCTPVQQGRCQIESLSPGQTRRSAPILQNISRLQPLRRS